MVSFPFLSTKEDLEKKQKTFFDFMIVKVLNPNSTGSEDKYLEVPLGIMEAPSGGTYVRENGSWVALSSKVLVKGNTASFTPTQDYDPSTKIYVDNLIASLQQTITQLTTRVSTLESELQGISTLADQLIIDSE